MPLIAPFAGIRYADGIDLSRVTTPPYDVISAEERAQLAALHEHNFVRLILPQASGDPYQAAGAGLREWLAGGILIRDDLEAFYVYAAEHPSGGEPLVSGGVMGALRLEAFGEGDVFPHERTMPGPKADRLELMSHTEANLEPVWLVTSRRLDSLKAILEEVLPRPPLASVTDPDSVHHRLWTIAPHEAGSLIEEVAMTKLVVADGHHRYETAVNYRDSRRAAEGPGPWDFALALVSDPVHNPPALFPIHRVIRGAAIEEIARRAGLTPFEGGLRELADRVRGSTGLIGVASESGRWLMRSNGPLDAAFLAEQVLDPSGVIPEYRHDLERLAAEVDRGGLAFVLAPVPLELVISYALSGRRMPPKTTLFWPKPRSGLVFRDMRNRVDSGQSSQSDNLAN